jgi:phage tail-like protein
MTVSTPFDRDLGVTQGRIRPVGWTAQLGEWVLCLGSDLAGVRARLANDDEVSVTQDAAITTETFLRPRVHLRGPSVAPPSGVRWLFEALVEGTVVLSLPVDRERDVFDLHLPLSHLVGTAEVALRLNVVGLADVAELELPAAYVDAIAALETEGPLLVNRVPGPGERGVPHDSTIQFDLCHTDAAGISSGATEVYVDGVLALVGGVFQPSFDGADSAITTRDGGRTLRVVVDPTNAFLSDRIVVVRVVGMTNDGLPIDVTYSFVAGDATAPQIADVTSPEENVVRVELLEPVRQVSAASADDALNPANWEVVLVEGPPAAAPYRAGAGVWVEVTAVRSIAPDVVELVTDIPMTAGATYRVIGTSVEDLSGNAMVAPNNSALFLAFEEVKLGRRFRLIEKIQPFHVTADATGDLRKFFWCLQEPLNLLFRRIDRWTDILDPDVAPEPYLDAMLVELGNPFTFALEVDDKRRLVRILVSIYRAKGTAQGIIDAIRFFLGLEVTINYPGFEGALLGDALLEEDWVLGGEPRDAYTYEILAPVSLSGEERARITEIAEYMQVAHEHLVGIVEPEAPPLEPDHIELGLSVLEESWELH